ASAPAPSPQADGAGAQSAPVPPPAPNPEVPGASEANAPAPPPAPAQPATASAGASGATGTNVVMPQMGESIAEGTIVKWLKKVGDAVQKDEPLFEISTDKVDAEIPSTVAGTLVEILAQEGETVGVNLPVARIGEAGEARAAAAASAPAPSPQADGAGAQSAPVPPPAPNPEVPGASEANAPAPPPAPAQPATASAGASGATGTNVVMPQMGESIAEGTIVKWLKKVGDAVQKDEPLFEISTDKVDAEIPSTVAGTLLAIHAQEGETVSVNSVVAVIGEAGAAVAPAPAPAAATPAPAPAQAAPAAPPVAPAPAPAAKAAGNGSVDERRRAKS